MVATATRSWHLPLSALISIMVLGGLMFWAHPQLTQACQEEEKGCFLRLLSYDSETGDPLEGVSYRFYRLEGVCMEGDLVVDLPSEVTASDERWVLCGEGVSGVDGTLSFGPVDYGMYMVVEAASVPGFQTHKATVGEGRDSDCFKGVHIFAIDANRPPQWQAFGHSPIALSTEVSFFEVGQSDQGAIMAFTSGETAYAVEFGLGDSNTFADEFWVEVLLDAESASQGVSLCGIELPSVENDCDGWVDVLVRSSGAESLASAVGMRFSQPSLHEESRGDGTPCFTVGDWRYVGKYPAGVAQSLNFSEIAGSEAKVTSVALCYGSVEKGFQSISPLGLMAASGQEPFSVSRLRHTAESHASRDWMAGQGSLSSSTTEVGGVRADAEDFVVRSMEGAMVAPDNVEGESLQVLRDDGNDNPSKTGKELPLARTADGLGLLALGLACGTVIGASLYFTGALCRKRKVASWKR